MSLHEDDLLKRVYRRHFQTIADGNVGFVQAAPAGLISNKQAEKERSDERYALHVITKIRAPDSDVRRDYETLMAMSDSDLQKEADDRMFSVKAGEPFPSRAHLRALAVGDARGVTDIWRQDRAPTPAQVVKMEDVKRADSKPDSANRNAPLPKPKPSIPPRFMSPLKPVSALGRAAAAYDAANAKAIPQQSRAVSR